MSTFGKILSTVTVAGAMLAGSLATAGPAQAATTDLYSTPGDHVVNGRYWRTSCEKYSSTIVRCRTDIYATKVVARGGQYLTQRAWVFNNQTYLPSARSQWKGNPLAMNGSWTSSDGRRWKSECDTRTTGRGACRAYIWANRYQPSNGSFRQVNGWTLNNIVKFSSGTVPAVTSIPASVGRRPGMPVDQPLPPPTQSGFRLDSRCLTGRAFCTSKSQRKMAWVVNGRIIKVVDVRFGSRRTPTRGGLHKISWKSRHHVSREYGSAMPFAMFFDGGQAIHYSSDFARRGYNGASHGCVNVRDRAGIEWLYGQAKVGDKVVVYN